MMARPKTGNSLNITNRHDAINTITHRAITQRDENGSRCKIPSDQGNKVELYVAPRKKMVLEGTVFVQESHHLKPTNIMTCTSE
jgi:hypothetical protein